jgi:hypothetical protein
MLRLQQYERLMKALLVAHEVRVTPSTVESAHAQRTAEHARLNLGELAKRLFKSFVVPGDIEAGDEAEEEQVSLTEVTFRSTFRIQMTREEYEQTKQAVKDFVDLRNTLVHHFLELFDVWTVDGCTEAVEYLQHSFTRVDEHLAQLKLWADTLNQSRLDALEQLKSAAIEDLLVHGIAPDGTVMWPIAGIVARLREAAAKHALDGWTPLEAAIAFVAEHHPEQTPEKYSCRSWPQVLNESKLFELRYTREPEAAKVAWYRERPPKP